MTTKNIMGGNRKPGTLDFKIVGRDDLVLENVDLGLLQEQISILKQLQEEATDVGYEVQADRLISLIKMLGTLLPAPLPVTPEPNQYTLSVEFTVTSPNDFNKMTAEEVLDGLETKIHHLERNTDEVLGEVRLVERIHHLERNTDEVLGEVRLVEPTTHHPTDVGRIV